MPLGLETVVAVIETTAALAWVERTADCSLGLEIGPVGIDFDRNWAVLATTFGFDIAGLDCLKILALAETGGLKAYSASVGFLHSANCPARN